MSRFARGSLVGLLFLLTASAARAQQLGAEAPMPLAVDLAKVPLGSWADYTMSMGAMAPMTARMALVARKGSSNTIEMTVSGGMMAMSGGSMVVQQQIEDDKKGTPTVEHLVMQLGSNDPMEMPPDAARGRRFSRPDPKTLIGSETIKAGGSSFKTKHYRDKTPEGDRIDYWISENVPPMGLVKMEIPSSTVKIELKDRGKGAKQAITKPAQPFDEEKLRKQAMAGAAGATPPAAPSKK